MKYSKCTINTLILINAFDTVASSVASTASVSASVHPYTSSSAAVFASASSSDDSDPDDNHILSDIDQDDEIPDDDDNMDDAVEYDEIDQGSGSEDEGEESMMQIHTDGESTDGSASQPLRTLKKLQAMLEETDYATATSASASASNNAIASPGPSANPPSPNYNSSVNAAFNTGQNMDYPEQPAPLVAQPIEQEGPVYPYSRQQDMHQPIHQSYPQQQNTRQKVERIASPRYDSDDDQSEENGQLWTSKDRSKYKKQRKLQREREIQKQRQRYLEQQEQHIHSDDDSHGTDMTDDTDDGLGYTLPNLPVYFSDAESTDDAEDDTSSPHEKRTIYQSSPPPQAINRPMDDSSTITNQSNQPAPPNTPNPSGALQQYDPNFQRRPPQQQGQSPPYHYHNMPYQQPMPSHQGPQPQISQGRHQYPYPPYQQPSHSQQIPLQQIPQTPQHPHHPPPYMYNNENAYGPMNPQQQYMQQMRPQQQYQSWTASQTGYPMPYPPQHHYQSPTPMQQQSPPQGIPNNVRTGFGPHSSIPSPPQRSDTVDLRTMEQSDKFQQMNSNNDLLKVVHPITTDSSIATKAVSLVDAGALLSFDTVQKIAVFSMWNCLLCYCAVSPRTLEMAEYNMQFKKIIQRVLTTCIAPLITFLLVLDVRENDLNSLVSIVMVAKLQHD